MSRLALLCSAATTLLSTPEGWESARFDGVAPNQIDFGRGGMTISVESSASPVFHLYSSPQQVSSLSVSGRVEGTLDFEAADDWPDDALLRVGIVVAAPEPARRLSLLAAPGWVRELNKRLRAMDRGVETIRTFHVMPKEEWVGRTRINPNVDVFQETVATAPGGDGRFAIEESFAPVEVLGIWVLADGDDTDSSFEVTIDRIEVE